MMPAPSNLLTLRLTVDYRGKSGVLRDCALEIRRGEILGLVGQSGSGKSTAALAILRLLDPERASVWGTIFFQGRELTAFNEREMRRIRGREIGLILQSPTSALNPALRLSSHFKEAWRAHSRSEGDMVGCVKRSLEAMGLPAGDTFLRRYPGELSVGQAQRVLIALATLHQPALLIADEPTSALDVLSQAEVLHHLAGLRREAGTAILFISHDLLSVGSICDRIAVLHDGEVVEIGPTRAILHHARHPYTQRLLAAVPGWGGSAAGNSGQSNYEGQFFGDRIA